MLEQSMAEQRLPEQPIPVAWRGVFEPLEAGIIATLRRHGACFETSIASALAIRSEGMGDAYFDLHDYADQIAIQTDETVAPTRWPAVQVWLAAMRNCAFAGFEEIEGVHPKLAHDCAIVVHGTHVYARRIWRTESDLAARVLQHATPVPKDKPGAN
jgi:hypothetical protein